MAEEDAPISRVEVFEDRAAVVRKVNIPADPGRHHLVIGPVSPLVRDDGIVFPGAPGVQVEEIRVERRRISRVEADSALAADLHERVQRARTASESADDLLRRARRAEELGVATVEAAVGWAPRVLLESDGAAFTDSVRKLADPLIERTSAVSAANLDAERARADHEAVKAELEAARAGSYEWRCVIHVRILVESAPAAPLELRYTVPCGVWRPVHRATLSLAGARPRLSWEVGAMVWNATGEPWGGVALVCSTRRPGEHASAPTLHDDPVQTRRRESQIVVEAREEKVEIAREGGSRQAIEVPGVEDGGEPRTYTAPGSVSVPSDGRPVHVRLEAWETDAEVAWMAYPELSSAVVLRARQRNAGSRPLLAGPVELIRDHGAVGRGRVGFVPAGEPFAIGFGSHDGVRITRKDTRKVERAMFSGHQTWAFEVKAKVANTGGEPVSIEIRERIPVSEVAEVKVSAPKASPAMAGPPDRDGMCLFKVEVPPGAVKELELTYTVDAPGAVVLPF